ncbi:uncharacterized protein H6S33_005817 [Morchella sextelata]|uniref:uncharacterized protein n=1 Tax=Morchella sextelata TaxID=1174677 RepID=UPI001D052CFB|nr:uncharacterized protein H6S33_005817 [Morchella sextelata]KAH0613931.1 hypothetical protein H6S33_005817 [Morchella sextelata]
MSWNPPPSGNNPHPNEWSPEEDRENLGGQSSEEEDTPENYHRRQQRYSEQSASVSGSPSVHHPHLQQHPLHPQQHHPQHQHQQHHPHHPRQSPPPPPPPPQSHQVGDHNPDQNMSYAEMYPYRIPPHQLAGFQQPAPRQRTAIACRYCRRRKIRCSGFESSPDGRCANCLRFNQECVFTPVSSQAQAFVPAHAAFGRGAPGRSTQQMLYGAHGQPLPASYLPPPPPPPPMDFHPPQQYPRPSSPTGSNRHPPPPVYNHPYDERMPIHDAAPTERNRTLELHPPLLPPPVSGNPGQSHSHPRRGSAGDYPNRYGRNDPPSPSSHLVSPHPAYSPPPATGPPSTYQGQNYGQGPPPSIPGNYYPQAQSSGSNPSQQRPRSPVGYHSPGDRSSGSPHPFHPPMQYPPRPTSSGPNPSNPSNHPIPSMQMSNLIDPGPQSQITNRNNQRSAADGDMLDKLRPRSGL